MVVRIKKLYPVLFSLIIIWIVSDLTLTHFDPLKYSPYFEKNDFEITQLKHPEKSWDKVVFGSSIAINSFNEELSGSGYINAGICYGTVSDIYQMLSKNIVDIESDLVLILIFPFMTVLKQTLRIFGTKNGISITSILKETEYIRFSMRV